MIKVLKLQKREEDEPDEFAVQLIDISEKILIDGLRTEQKYMTYIRATVSHEMRNPLNSINAQISNQR